MIVASVGHLQMDILSHVELNYKTGHLHLCQIAGIAGCILTTSDFREPAVYLVTSIRGTPVSCLTDYQIAISVAIHETSKRTYLIKLYLPKQVRLYICNCDTLQ